MNNEFFEFSSLSSDDSTALLTQLSQLSHVIIDHKGVIRHISEGFSQFIGDSVSNILGRSFSDFLPSGHQACFAIDTIGSATTSIFKEVLLLADGSQRLVDLTIGDVSSSSETLKVITHFSIQTSDHLQDSRHLFEQSGIAEFLLTPNELEIIAANHGAQVLCGLNETTLTQMLFSELCELPRQQLLTKLNKLYFDREKSVSLDLIVASGEPQLVQLRANPVQLSGTTLLHLQIIDALDQKEQVYKLQRAEDLTDSLFDSLPMASLLMDSFGIIGRINHEMSELLGKSTDQLIGHRASNVLPQKLSTLISPMETSTNKLSLLINNQIAHVNFSQQPIRDNKNQSLGLLLTIEPIKTTHLPLRLKALELANEMAIYSIFVTDKQGEVIYVNEGFEHQSGYKARDIVGHNISLLKDDSNDPFIFTNMWDVINKKRIWRGTLKNLNHSGRRYWVDVTIKPMLDDSGDIECFVGMSVDVTQQRELYQTGVYIANYDLATGLANEVLAKDRLDGMLSRARRRKSMVAVVYLDISKIESLTQEFGSVKCNEMLSIYCQMVKAALRSEDALVRMSKTRLALLLPDLSSVAAIEVVVAKIDQVNSQPIAIADNVFDLDITQGVAHFPEQGGDADSLFLNAESSLQQAWHANERIGSFGEQQNHDAVMNYNLRRDIATALENEELEILYQPILDLGTNNVISLAAKLQWQHQRHGVISGDDIYAVAEASGIMAQLGWWLLEQACADLKHWREQGDHQFTLSISLSHGQLRDLNIAQTIAEILDRCNLPANFICLELPLSHIATQWVDLDTILEEFALLGISLQYDRFGERGGYISDLRHFPFTGLKLSSEYVSQLSDEPSAVSLIQGIISLAKALDMTVTAVDVSQLSQLLQLQEMGCHFVQGDINCRYSSRDEIDTFLIRQQSDRQFCWE